MSEPPGPGGFDDSRAVLIGTGSYEHPDLLPLPAARNSLTAVHRMLTDPQLCGWPEERITVIPDPADPHRPAATPAALVPDLRRLAKETRGVLVLYYVGHGLVLPRGELCLALGRTDPAHADVTGLAFGIVREAFLESPARAKAVVLDCCYAGRAIEALSGDAVLAGATAIRGTYVLTASDGPAHVVPLAEQADRPTSFTGTLVDLVRAGLPGGPKWLTLEALYPDLCAESSRRGLPAPNQKTTDSMGRFAFTRNAAHRPPPPRASPLAKALTAALAQRADAAGGGAGGPGGVTAERLAEATGRSTDDVTSYLTGRAIPPRAFLDAFAAFLAPRGRPLTPSGLRRLHDLRTAELRDSPNTADQVVHLRETVEHLRQAVADLTRQRDEERRARSDDRSRARREAQRLAALLDAEEERGRRLREESEAKGRRLDAAVGYTRALEEELTGVREQAETVTRELHVLRGQVSRLLDPADPPAADPPATDAPARVPATVAATAADTTDAPAPARHPAAGTDAPPGRARTVYTRTLPGLPPGHRAPGWARGLLVLVGVAAVALGFARYAGAYTTAGAYLTAPVCGTPAAVAGADCLLRTTGRVTDKQTKDGTGAEYDLTMTRGAPAPTDTSVVDRGFYDAVEIGMAVDLKVWRGRVMEISKPGQHYVVEYTPFLTCTELALLIGLGTALTIVGAVGPKPGAPASAARSGALIASFAWIVSGEFLTDLWPFTPTLVVSAVGWVLLTAVGSAAAASREYRLPD
ncbi:helix-turn-helix domain-containing protein [Kitasatospora sp. NPDC059599]|uniref:caspase, EACC1-associated type n=1 Tax=Kitasatospora sp. NPDC059599 TaxID=3346880 RepID=UPI0036B1279E